MLTFAADVDLAAAQDQGELKYPVQYESDSSKWSQENSGYRIGFGETEAMYGKTDYGKTELRAAAKPRFAPSQDDTESDEPVTLSQWPRKQLTEIRINPYLVQNPTPSDQSQRLLEKYTSGWELTEHSNKLLMWEAPALKYKPLLFEDVALERYGHVVRNDFWQTTVSAVHFFSSAALLPLHARHEPVWGCDYPLGYCRPGNCTNSIFQRQFWGRRR